MAFPTVIDGPVLSLVAAATYAAGTRVKLNASGQAEVAGLTDAAIGYLTERGSVSGQLCSVRSVRNSTNIGRAHSSMAVGALLYSAAAGRVDDADGGSAKIVGFAGNAASAQDDHVLVYGVDG